MAPSFYRRECFNLPLIIFLKILIFLEPSSLNIVLKMLFRLLRIILKMRNSSLS